mmetsp:Transcript_3775/g.10914  ORF Transcript_3775/g.10914 Transcript_3775/m.10914 type:complete len:274 (-) Transcript_3775:239-1060(-)
MALISSGAFSIVLKPSYADANRSEPYVRVVESELYSHRLGGVTFDVLVPFATCERVPTMDHPLADTAEQLVRDEEAQRVRNLLGDGILALQRASDLVAKQLRRGHTAHTLGLSPHDVALRSLAAGSESIGDPSPGDGACPPPSTPDANTARAMATEPIPFPLLSEEHAVTGSPARSVGTPCGTHVGPRSVFETGAAIKRGNLQIARTPHSARQLTPGRAVRVGGDRDRLELGSAAREHTLPSQSRAELGETAKRINACNTPGGGGGIDVAYDD